MPPLDLSRIDASGAKKLVVPRDIFQSLPHRPWSRLRLEQGEVLKEWFDRRDEQDLVIKQNTGGGKTVVGLLVAQSSLNEGVGPAAYLVPDTYLVQQVIDAADELGIAVTDDARAQDFRSSNAILVTTFHKVVNGKSVFGVSGGSRDVTMLGTIVIDDAHAALAVARNQFTASIPSSSEVYTKLLAIFAADLRGQSERNYKALTEGDRSAPIRIPFWAWAERSSEVARVLSEQAANDDLRSLFFTWPLLADHLHLAAATVTSGAVEIKTPCPPVDMIPTFARARRRIYLTATLADDSVLVTELDAAYESVRRPITPERAADLGDRMILAPKALNPNLGDDAVRELARSFADGDRDGDGAPESDPVNVVVLVPSDKQATWWDRYADHTLHVDDMKPVIERLTAGEHMGLVVLVNKYDGVDLPGDACRLLVIDGIPTPLDATERRESAALAGSATFQARKVQKIEQGMGRGIRDAEDHCAVLLLGDELGLALVDRTALGYFSPATRAQVALSQQVADQIAGEGLVAVRDALTVFLDREESWRQVSSTAIAGVEYDRDGHVSDVAIARRAAFNKAAVSDPAAAMQTLRDALSGLDAAERGWYLEEVAAYQHHVDAEAAQRTIRAARELNREALMPKVRIPAARTRGSNNQARDAFEYLTDTYGTNPAKMSLRFNMTLSDIAWDDTRTAEAEEAFRALGQHLGFASSRPDTEFSVGPDVLWALDARTHAVIELKTGVTREPCQIIRDEANQLSGSVQWDREQHRNVETQVPVLVHPSASVHQQAVLPEGARVVTADDLERLKASVLAFVGALVDNWSTLTERNVATALTDHGLTAEHVIRRHSTRPVTSTGPGRR